MILFYPKIATIIHQAATHYIVKENIFSLRNKCLKAIIQKEINKILAHSKVKNIQNQ